MKALGRSWSGRFGHALVLSIILALLAALLPAPLHAETSIKFSLNGKIDGAAAPFLMAADRGFFRNEGLEVTITPANNSAEAIQRIAANGYDLAVGDINALIRYRDQRGDAAVKAAFIVFNKPSHAVLGRKSRGILTPKDLEGKRIATPPTDDASALWPIFVSNNGIDPTKLTMVSAGAPVREPMLVSGEVDAITGFLYAAYPDIKDRGMPAEEITVMLMSDYGIDLYGNAILVSPKFATENPEAVKAFLRAFLRGLKETIKQPASAAEIVSKHNLNVSRPILLEQLQIAIRSNILTPEVKLNGFGAIDSARFDKAVEQIGRVIPFKSKPPAATDIFDSSFLPPIGDRKVN
ncbi:MAG TPA: ABC transporter substrate-binding protein [Xanthobacteraceae bacterium]|nr:ABC transporter substrate-binding protein [Xanthobacteraceae bacterium]